MATSSIITRGFGPGATVALVVTAGYDIGVLVVSAPLTVTARSGSVNTVSITPSVVNTCTTQAVTNTTVTAVVR